MQQTPEQGPAVGPQVIFGFDTTGRCTLSTGIGLEWLGLEPGELVGQDLFDVYGADETSVAALHRVLAGETFTIEREFRGRLLAVYYEPTHSPSGTVIGAIGVTTDVTEQRRIEFEARAARQRAVLLGDVSAALARETHDLESLLHLAARAVAEPVADGGVVWLRATDGEGLDPRARWSRYDDRPAAAGHETEPGRPDLTAAQDLHVPQRLETPATGTFLRVPLRSRGLLLGVIDLSRAPSHGPFTTDDVDLVTELAERCALALDNALLLGKQREAHEQLVKFQALADASDNLVAITDDADTFVYTNPRVTRSGIQVSSLDVWSAATAYAGESVSQDIRGGLESTGRWSGDIDIAAAGSAMVGHLDAFRLSHPETGVALGTAWIVIDVTELRATEAALRAANADLGQFKALVEASTDFIAIAGMDGDVRYVNPAGREMVGLDPDVDVTTTSIADYLTPEGIRASAEIEQPAVIAHGHWEGESTLRNRRGPAVPVAIGSFLIRDAHSGEPFALATVQRDLSERLAAEAALRELAEQRQSLLTRLVDAQEAERTRIAADVHDDPVQALAAVDLRLGLLQRRLQERSPELLESLEPLRASVTGATERLRALLFDLGPPDFHDGLSGALSTAAEATFEGTGTRWTVQADQEPDVPDAVRAVAYRICVEALTNARKHAHASQVTIAVRASDGGIEVSVADDGSGLGPDPMRSHPGHRGLLNMQDRAAIAGGWCTLSSPVDGGTLVTTWLPGRHPSMG